MYRRILLYITAVFSCVLVTQAAPVSAAAPHSKRVCGTVRPGFARCDASILTDAGGVSPLVSNQSRGYGPADFRAAYGVNGTNAGHVAVVVAYDAPTIAADVDTYSRAFGLPSLPTCSSSAQTTCLSKVGQDGSAHLPPANSSWAVETSLDVESVHGMCPHCRITLVEANSASINNLSTAAQQAANLGAQVISNSYGGGELAAESSLDDRYNHPGTTMVVSSGDSGYGTSYPAASPYVVAVGGTSLHMANGHVTDEEAWSGAGSGCSNYEPKPSWQHDGRCTGRSIADVAADADPATGAAIYDSYSSGGRSGWFTVGGTSLAAPLVAGIIASSGSTMHQPAGFYAHPTLLRDIVSGSNGNCAGYFCKANAGYDGPTGLGVVNHL